MTLSQKVQLGVMLVSALGVASVLPAFAATTDSTNVSLAITGGVLSIDIPNTSYTLSGVTLKSTQQTSTVTISGVVLEDTRGSLAGFASNIKFTNFQGQTDPSKHILLGSSAGGSFTSATKYLTVTNSNVTVVAGNDSVSDLTTYTTPQLISSLSDLTGNGESNAFNLLDAPSGHGAGKFTVDVGVNLKIPAYGQYPGGQNITAQSSYQGTVTASIS